DGLFAGVDSGRYDTVINGVDWTEDRAAKYDFSDPYLKIYTVLITKTEDDAIKSFEDLKGKKTANSLESTYMQIAESYGATVTGVDSLEETINMVLAGRVDATLNAEVSFDDYMNVHPDTPLKVAARAKDANDVVIPFRKGDNTKTLREAVNQAIRELKADGTLKTLSEKYFGKDYTE
ncbi:MAG: transporter substrate-binding domain-containing protein, partial [Lachnospiraceae bacterium]|nr:transporter substrate-binding domain-containing protein [Lachnospiraceae bacterium]